MKTKPTNTQSLSKQIKDLEVSEFTKSCYLALIKVPAGKVVTYRSIAEFVGTKAYRAVGTAMSKNPLVPMVPCHRVVRTNGDIGEYAYGQNKKIALLKKEGVQIAANNSVDLEKFMYKF